MLRLCQRNKCQQVENLRLQKSKTPLLHWLKELCKHYSQEIARWQCKYVKDYFNCYNK